MSEAFREYPFDAEVIYRSPVQFGPANLLHAEGTGYSATMIGFPYDDIDGWRGPYPAAVLEAQFARVAAGWEDALRLLDEPPAHVTGAHRTAYEAERRVAEAALLHWKSVAHQCRFVIARRRHREAMAGKDRAAALSALNAMERVARGEEEGARRLLALAARDSRLGFEASNAYFYVPVDLLEKVINTRWIVEEWIPARREEARRG